MRAYKILLSFLAVFLVGCETAEIKPALRLKSENINDNSREVLERVISEMLGDTSTLIAEDAFVEDVEIVVERRRVNDSEGNRILDRTFELPVHFRLWKQRNICLLEYVETGEMSEIPGLRCSEKNED
ncbi:MAG: hypothetical protein ACJ0BT_01505 [Pseudohongiellaceae bacterium]